MAPTTSASLPAAAPTAEDDRLTARGGRLGAAVRTFVASRALVWSIVVFAAALRTFRFASDRSLWLDESYLALNLMSKSYSQLAGTLDFNQGAPVGYLFLEKVAVGLFGDGEYALRLPSFLAGLASVVVFVDVARRYLPRAAVPVAVFFFGVLEPFVYYSSETKQYGLDVLVTLCLLALFARVVDRPLTLRSTGLMAVAGAVAVWFSHPAPFVLAGYGAVAAWLALRRRNAGDLARQGFVYLVWLGSFGVEYVLSIRHLNSLRTSIVGAGPAGSGHSASFTKELVKNVYTIFSDPGQQPRTTVGVTAFAAAVGAYVLARRSGPRMALLVAPGVVAFGAGVLRRYPVGQRFILFLLPIAVLLVCAGMVALVKAAEGGLRIAIALVLGALVLAPATATAVGYALRAPDAEPMQPLLASLSQRWRSGDVLYLFPYSQYAFRYYLTCRDCNAAQRREKALWPFAETSGRPQSAPAVASRSRTLVVGEDTGDAASSFRRDLRRLDGKQRVWILISHYYPLDLSTLTGMLDAAGTRVASMQRGSAVLYLYDFARSSR